LIVCKSTAELDQMRLAGKIVASVLEVLESRISPGITTKKLDEIASKEIYARGGRSAFLGYRGYPASICTSVNEEVVHGVPGNRVLEEGDIISIDVGVEKDGYYGDAAITLPVGNIGRQAQELIDISKQALNMAIKQCKPANRLYDISASIQNIAEKAGYNVVREFVGHGIGQQMHEDPQIPNFGMPGTGPLLKQGMVLALEPMVNMGVSEVVIGKDNWTVTTFDKKLSAHFEHTVAITNDGPQILTQL